MKPTSPTYYNPQIKAEITIGIYEFLYSKLDKNFEQRLNNILYLNQIAGGYSTEAIRYKGQYYEYSKTNAHSIRLKVNSLVNKLKPEMDSWIAEREKLQIEEVAYVMGYVKHVLNSSNYFLDYLKLLPEVVHPAFKEVIGNCDYRIKKLSDEKIIEIINKNEMAISLIKQRLARNLLI